uniref:Uncharacterized protein n=1 Tax=Clytia hemisphaerica TaxID=252671 RepID=A0A7M5UYE4_9CNID
MTSRRRVLYYFPTNSFSAGKGSYLKWVDKSKLVVPSQLKEEVLIWSHDTSHFGVNKTFDRIRSKYYWQGFYKEIQNWVLSCEGCNRKKNPKRSNFQLMTIPCSEPLSAWAIDVLGPFKRTVRENRYIVVFTETYTKWPEAVATSHTRAPLIAEIILERIVYRFGAPRQLLSDRGKNFLARLVAELSTALRIKRVHTTAYHPATNGLVERYNGTLARTLAQFTDAFQDDWDTHINSALFAYRVTPHSTTRETPFFLLHGRDPRMPLDVALIPPTELEGELAEQKEQLITSLRLAQETAKENMQRSQQANEERKTPVDAPFLVGDLVWLHVPDSIKGLSNKLRFRWHGPYRIVEQISPVNFKLEIEGRRVPVNVHASRIKKYTPRERPDNEVEGEDEFCDVPLDCIPLDSMPHVPDPTVEIEQEDLVYRVERILKSRKRSGITSYLVKWQGYPLSQATWEPSENILDPNLIVDFNRRTKQKKANKAKAKEKKEGENKRTRKESLNMIVVKEPENENHSNFSISNSIITVLVFIMLFTLGSAARLGPRELGYLYDCTTLQRNGR